MLDALRLLPAVATSGMPTAEWSAQKLGDSVSVAGAPVGGPVLPGCVRGTA